MDKNIDSVLEGLNEEQLEAARTEGHCLTSACPGSGKTKMMATKAAYFILRGKRVMAVTFTKDSAVELTERIQKAVGSSVKGKLLSGTFHALCYKMLGTKLDLVIEGERIGYIARAIDISSSDFDLDEAIQIIEHWKTGNRTGGDDSPEGKLVAAYQNLLERNKKIDFQDMINMALSGLRSGSLKPYPADMMLVDEFQDTDALQYEWIALHAKAGVSVTVVGDDDQSIYAFRHAMGYEGMERFATEFKARRIVLGMNYRSHAEILDRSSILINNNTARIPKALVAHKGRGGRVGFWLPSKPKGSTAIVKSGRIDEADAAVDFSKDAVSSNKSVAILARTNVRLDTAESSLIAANVKYVRSGGGSILSRPEAAAFTTLIDIVHGNFKGLDNVLSWAGMPESDLSIIHAKLGTGIVRGGKKALEDAGVSKSGVDVWREFAKRYEEWGREVKHGADDLVLNGIAVWMDSRCSDKRGKATTSLMHMILERMNGSLLSRSEALRRKKSKDIDMQGYVTLSTMHASKGLEWDWVWIVSAEETVTPDEKSATEEERRLFFVAMTRAKERLMISTTGSNPVSRFVLEAGVSG